MITGLTIHTKYVDPLFLSMPGGGEGYLVRSIDGLGPVPITLSSTPLAQLDKEILQGNRRERRTIILSVKLDQNWGLSSIESRRKRLYSLAVRKNPLTMEFATTDKGPVLIDGYVEDVDSDPFSDDPVVVLTIACLDPDFRDSESDSIEGVMGSNLYFANYEGDVPTGMVITIFDPGVAGRSQVRFRSYYQETGEETGHIYHGPGFTPGTGRFWIISTIPGNKYFEREVGAVASFFNNIDHQSLIWPILYPGANLLTMVSEENPPDAGPWEFSISWTNLYGAI